MIAAHQDPRAVELDPVPYRPHVPRPTGAADPSVLPPLPVGVGETPGTLEIAAQHMAHPAEIAGHQPAHCGAAIGAGLHRRDGPRLRGCPAPRRAGAAGTAPRRAGNAAPDHPGATAAPCRMRRQPRRGVARPSTANRRSLDPRLACRHAHSAPLLFSVTAKQQPRRPVPVHPRARRRWNGDRGASLRR